MAILTRNTAIYVGKVSTKLDFKKIGQKYLCKLLCNQNIDPKKPFITGSLQSTFTKLCKIFSLDFLETLYIAYYNARANPTITSYNASVVKIARFKIIMIVFYF
jgi:hypothetical protein